MKLDMELVRRGAQIELARREFYEYCQLRYPRAYTDDKPFLKQVCDTFQAFIEQNEKRFLIITMPPRHYKSFTAKNATEWLFGKNPSLKVMTGSYNETLSTTFARQVRNTIEERKVDDSTVVYGDIFPDTRVKYGEASASIWSLEGFNEKSYLATSPKGTATGFGANIVLVDDIIKNAEEAYNELVLDGHWEWFTNTMMQRTEGDDWKFVIIMTRWATADLAGRILDAYGDQVELITFKAVQDDGSMLCESVLNHDDFLLKTQEMNEDIVAANYNQEPIDVKGRLYTGFVEYEKLPNGDHKKWNYTDTADKGADFLCSIDYIEHEGDVYVTDLVFTDEPMEVTEPQVAQMLHDDEVNEAIVESNNGGRGWARNVERELEQLGNAKCVVTWVQQTANKEARILSSSAWVQRHVLMPENWTRKYREFARQLLAYQKKGKNKHDDAPDVLAAIYERVANPSQKESRVTVI